MLLRLPQSKQESTRTATLLAVFSVLLVSSALQAQPALELDVTVGLASVYCTNTQDLNTCGTIPAGNDNITASPGDSILVQYTVENTGSDTLYSHDLSDNLVGSILSGFVYKLAPASGVYLQRSLAASTTSGQTFGFATWTGENGVPISVFGSDGYVITVPAPQLVLDVRIALAADYCSNLSDAGTCTLLPAGLDAAVVGPGDQLVIMYLVENTGLVPLILHDATDSSLGDLLIDFPFTLSPADSVFLPLFDTAPTGIGIKTRSGTWTGEDAGGNQASSTDPYAFLVSQLPVELISFEGLVTHREVQLAWSTASEMNNSGFGVEYRSKRSEPLEAVYEQLVWVEGAGSTLEQQTYTYKTNVMEPGVYEFRLKQIDFDGNFEYFGPIELSIEVPGSLLVSDAYPNPFSTTSTFTVAVAQEQMVDIVVFDLLGRAVQNLYEGRIRGGEPVRFTVNGSELPSGVYVYRVQGETFAETRKVTVRK